MIDNVNSFNTKELTIDEYLDNTTETPLKWVKSLVSLFRLRDIVQDYLNSVVLVP